jgi:hypothetical protein
MKFTNMNKSKAEKLFRNLGQRKLWLSFVIAIAMLSIVELFFEPVIDHFMQGSIVFALGLKLALGIILRPLETKIHTKTIALNTPSDKDLSEDDDTWALVLMRVYRAKKEMEDRLKKIINTKKEDDRWALILMRVYRASYLTRLGQNK